MTDAQAGWMKRLVSLVAPDGLLVIAAAIVLRLDAVRDHLAAFARFYPYAVCVVGALLAWRFHRNRLLLALLVLALATFALGRHAGGASGLVIVRATALLLPLNLAALGLLRDRGTLTPVGLARLAAIAAQVILVVMFSRTTPAATAALLGHAWLPAKLLAGVPLRQPALLAFVVALGVTAVPLVLDPNATSRGFLWAILAALLAVAAHRPGPAAAIYLGTADLVLVVSVIEASYLLAYQDGLTHLPARRALTEALQRLGGQYTIAMVDVDHFKRFNDEFGHDVGDHVLRMVAAKLARVQGGGRAYRYGGEEFAILFPGKEVDDTLPHLEAVREEIADSAFTIRGRLRAQRKRAKTGRSRRRQAAITISIGVAERSSRHGLPDQVIRAADQALYRAKEDGRNRVRS